MKKIRSLLINLIAVLILLSLVIPQDSLKEVFAASDDETKNRIFIDVTYDPETQTYSLLGLSDKQLKALGAPGFEAAIWEILSRFDSLNLAVNNSQLNLKTNDLQLATIKWDEESMQLLYDSIDSYGMDLSDTTKERLALWLNDADVVLNVRNSSDLSDPLVLQLDTLFMVDISKEGQVAVEGFDTGFALQPEIVDMVELGGVGNATLLWDEGVLLSKVNGNTLPEVTVYEDGLEVIDEALGLGLGDLAQYFQYQLGASVSFDGAEHDTIETGE